MVIVYFFFMPVILSCLPLVYSANKPICRERFSCPNLLPFKYPFYNSTDSSSCGLIKVKCVSYGGEFQFGRWSYPITYKLDSNSSFYIRNYTFEKLVIIRSCEALMNNFTSPSPLLFSFSINSHINIFKCPKGVSYNQGNDAYFHQRNYYNNSCPNHNFYYKHPINATSVPSDLPVSCQVIQLPVKQTWQELPRNETNIFSLLSSGFLISFPLSATCEECSKNGSHCHTTDNGNVQCLHLQKVPAVKHGTQLTLILDLVLAGSAFILILCPAIFIIQRRYKRKPFSYLSSKYNANAETFIKNHDFLAPKRYSYSQVQKMTNSFEVKLGQGGFGSVYKGALTNELVAVKILSEAKDNGEDFINEIASIGRTSHVNVVRLVGFCLEGLRRALIYEFMPNGSLEKFTYKQQSSSTNMQLGWEKLHQIAIGIARGLEYLHKGCNTRILHFDIKPHNILLDKDLCPKISDFGLAKLFHENRSMISMSHMRGTPGYIAPELFSRNFGQVSHKSDVYSYGMMILEMIGGRKYVEVEVDHTSEIYFPHWIYKKIELDEEQLELHGIVSDSQDEMARKMIIVGLWCIQTNPLTRPTITKVLEMLEGDLASLEIPPKPYLSSPPRSTFTD